MNIPNSQHPLLSSPSESDYFINPRTKLSWTRETEDALPENPVDKPLIATRLANLAAKHLKIHQYPLTSAEISTISPFKPSTINHVFKELRYILPRYKVRYTVRFPHRELPEPESEDMEGLRRELRVMERELQEAIDEGGDDIEGLEKRKGHIEEWREAIKTLKEEERAKKREGERKKAEAEGESEERMFDDDLRGLFVERVDRTERTRAEENDGEEMDEEGSEEGGV